MVAMTYLFEGGIEPAGMPHAVVVHPDIEAPSSFPLQRYEAAKRALAEYRSVDEVKDYRDKAIAVKAYAQQAGDRQLEIDAAEARLRSERRLGELMAEMPKHDGGRPAKTGVQCTPVLSESPHREAPPTLDSLGIDKNLAKSARSAAALPESEFESVLATHREQQKAVTASTLKSLQQKAKAHVSHNSGENEWYTPPEYIESARRVLGDIDLDPASNDIAQQTVKATTYYTKQDDGLAKSWSGRVWMNPPYAKDLIGKFVSKLVKEFQDGNVTDAIVLVNNATDSQWFQELAAVSTFVCFPKGRVKFLSRDGSKGAPLQGQAILYLGSSEGFASAFRDFGFCVERHGDV